MAERDSKGWFLPDNKVASKGGTQRAKKLTPERRSEIAAAGWRGFQANYLRLQLLLADLWDARATVSEGGGLMIALDAELVARLKAAVGEVD